MILSQNQAGRIHSLLRECYADTKNNKLKTEIREILDIFQNRLYQSIEEDCKIQEDLEFDESLVLVDPAVLDQMACPCPEELYD